jgi:hypothetical protein
MLAPGRRKTGHYAEENVGRDVCKSLNRQRRKGRKRSRESQLRGMSEARARTSGHRTRTTHWNVRWGSSVRTAGGRLRLSFQDARENSAVSGGWPSCQHRLFETSGRRTKIWFLLRNNENLGTSGRRSNESIG